jgi:hypothetical protein
MSVKRDIMDFRWDLLNVQVPLDDRLIVRLAQPNRSLDVYIAVDGTGCRSILVRIPSDDQGVLKERISRGIRVQTIECKVDANGLKEVFVEITCLEPEGRPVLDLVASEIVDALVKFSSIKRIQLIQGVLLKWRKFWSDAPQKLLSKEQQIGLFGELWFLCKWLIPKIGTEKAVTMWRGPIGSRNDFESQGISVEVKTSGRIDESHQINGLEQLLTPDNSKLYFFSLLVRDEAGGPHSLGDLVRELKGLLEDNLLLRQRFEGMLAAADFQESDIEQYQKTRFRIRGQGLYLVEEGFPRLIPQSIEGGTPIGVHDVKYGLRLHGAQKWLVADNPNASVFN